MFARLNNGLARITKTLLNSDQYSKMSSNVNLFNDNEKNRMVWVDLEMTDLNIDIGHIIEMACIITDHDLNIIAESSNLIIHHSDEVLNNMGEWQIKNFQQSGLTKESRESTVTLEQAEREMVKFIQTYTPPGSCPLAGNSVHEDRRFLLKYMKNFTIHLHYRIIDVSTLKELCKRWKPDIYKNQPVKQSAHRALQDIRESIEEMKYYRDTLFK